MISNGICLALPGSGPSINPIVVERACLGIYAFLALYISTHRLCHQLLSSADDTAQPAAETLASSGGNNHKSGMPSQVTLLCRSGGPWQQNLEKIIAKKVRKKVNKVSGRTFTFTSYPRV